MSLHYIKNGVKKKIIPKLPSLFPSSRTTYNNTASGLSATNVQGAIDELAQSGGSTYTEGDGIDISNNEISIDTTFTEASTRANITSGDKFSTILGKIKKFFTDLKAVAFTGSYNDLSDKPTIPDISTKVSKSGDTMSGRLTANGKMSVPTNGGSWISQKDTSKASIQVTTKAVTDGSRFDSIIGGMSTDDSTWVMGIMNNTLYFGRYASDQTDNDFTASVAVDLINGYVSRANYSNNAGKATYDSSERIIESTYASILNTRDVNGTKYLYLAAPAHSTTPISEIAVSTLWRAIVDNLTSTSTTASLSANQGRLLANGSARDSTKLPLAGGTMTGALLIGTGSGAASASTPMAITFGRVQGYGSLYINGDTDRSESEYVLITSGRGVSSTLADGLAIGYSTLQWQGQNVIHSGNIGSQSVNYANSAGSATDNTARNTANAALPKAGGTMTGAINFLDGNKFIAGYSNNWLDVYATGGVTYRSLYHDFKNAAGSEFTNISARGVYLKWPNGTQVGTLLAEGDCTTISEDRGNGVVIRADTGLWIRPRGTGLTFTSCNASAFNVNSSRRYKENISPLSEEEAEKILEVETVTFDYINKDDNHPRQFYNQRGVIAEQVEEIIPSAVTLEKVDGEDVPGYVDYSKFVPYLIKMVQIQQKEIDELKAIVKAAETVAE